MCSADAVREIKERVLDNKTANDTDLGLKTAIDTIRRIGLEIFAVGETKMKGFEIPEVLSLVYPKELVGRRELESAGERDPSGSKVQFSVTQMRQLATLCVRLEVLASSRVLRAPLPPRRGSAPASKEESPPQDSVIMYADSNNLIPNITEKASDRDLMALLDSLSLRIENALSTLSLRYMGDRSQSLLDDLQRGEQIDKRTLMQLLTMLQSALPPPPQLSVS